MKRKPGRPRKIVQDNPETVEKTFENPPGDNMGGDDFTFGERESVYQQYGKENYPVETPPEGEVAAVKTEEQAQVEQPKKEEPETVAGTEEKPEAEPVAEKTETVETYEKSDIKVVPYAALHEERERRKELQEKSKEYEAQLKQLIDDNRKLMERVAPPTTETGEYEPVYRKELQALVNQISDLKTENDNFRKRFQTQDEREKETVFEDALAKVDDLETKAGRPGFRKIGRYLVHEELRQMALTDPDKARALDNPDGWRIIHEKVHGEGRKIFTSVQKQELAEQKVQAKKEANLVTTPGKNPSPASEKKEWSYEDYMKARYKANLM